MPLVYQQNINHDAELGLWQIAEDEDFFSAVVHPLHLVPNPRKRLQHLTALYTLNRLNGNFPFAEVRIAESGKPYLENENGFFSLSHSDDFAAAIYSTDFRVGIDVETYRDRIHRVAPRFLSDTEQQLLSESVNPGSGLNYLQVLTAAWSVKEALYKWEGRTGVDFIRHLHLDNFTIADGRGKALCRVQGAMPRVLNAELVFFETCCMAWVVG